MDKTKIVKGGEDAQFYEVRLIRLIRNRIIDKRRDVYGLTTKEAIKFSIESRKEEKQ